MADTAQARQLNPREVRLVSIESHTDPRSVIRHLRGELIRPTVAARIAHALKTLARRGIIPPIEQA